MRKSDPIRARKPMRLPVVMTREEVKAVLPNLTASRVAHPLRRQRMRAR